MKPITGFSNRIKSAFRILVKGNQPAQPKRDSIPSITAEEVAEARQFFPMDKFFIFGHARSGTTLLARLVRLHPEVHCNWQLHLFTRPPLLKSLVSDPEVGSWLSRRSNRWNHGGDLSPLVLRAASDFILERDARRVGKRIVGDKSPSSLLDGEAVRLMHAVYPDGRLIYIIRDGRDTVISHRFQAFIDSPQHLSKEDLKIRQDFADNPMPFLHGERSIFTKKGIQRAAQGWVRNMLETESLGKELFVGKYYSLRYEDLLAKPWEEMLRLWEFLGVKPPELLVNQSGAMLLKRENLENEMNENPDADWQQEKASQIAQALQKGKQGTWQEMFTQRDREAFHTLAGDTLEAYGYPTT